MLYALDFCLSLGGQHGRRNDRARAAATAAAADTIIFCCALTDESGDQEVISKLGPQPGHTDKKPPPAQMQPLRVDTE